MRRRLVTFVLVTAVTTFLSSYWLYGSDFVSGESVPSPVAAPSARGGGGAGAVRSLIPWMLVTGLVGCRTSMVMDATPASDSRLNWNIALHEIVTEDGLVDYDLLEEEYRGSLESFLALLADESEWGGRLTRDWHGRHLNAYNAAVIYQVLERERPASVQEPRRLLPFDGAAFFLETQFKIGRDWLSLSEIHHERVRQREMDVRDHAAINWAAVSSPPMRNELYRTRPESLQRQLDDQMTRWVMSDRGLRFVNGELQFNPIFKWYARDFQFWTAGQDICSVAADFAGGKRAQRLRTLAGKGCPHTYFDFDWSLNDAANLR